MDTDAVRTGRREGWNSYVDVDEEISGKIAESIQ